MGTDEKCSKKNGKDVFISKINLLINFVHFSKIIFCSNENTSLMKRQVQIT